MENKPKQPTPYPLRMPDDLRSKLEEEANKIGRSLHAEIISRLEQSFSEKSESFDNFLTDEAKHNVKDLALKNGISFEEAASMMVMAASAPHAPELFYIKVQQGLTAKDYHELFAVAREKIHPLATIVLSPEP